MGRRDRALAGKPAELIEFLKRLDEFYAMDSGPAHLAAALGVKTTVFSDRTCLWRCGPSDTMSRWSNAATSHAVPAINTAASIPPAGVLDAAGAFCAAHRSAEPRADVTDRLAM